MTFQSIVVKVAIVIFIILMVVMALMMIKGKENKKWPPETPTCPDYWKYKEGTDGKPGVCEDVLKLSKNGNHEWPNDSWMTDGKPNSAYKEYNTPNNKCCWAKYKAQVEWDGITNNSKLCKDCPDNFK